MKGSAYWNIRESYCVTIMTRGPVLPLINSSQVGPTTGPLPSALWPMPSQASGCEGKHCSQDWTVFGTCRLTFARHQDLPGVEERSSFLVVTLLDFPIPPLNPGIGLKQVFKAMVGIQNQPMFSVHAVTVRACLGEGLAPGRPCRVAFIIPPHPPGEFTLESLILPWVWEKSQSINQSMFIECLLCARH